MSSEDMTTCITNYEISNAPIFRMCKSLMISEHYFLKHRHILLFMSDASPTLTYSHSPPPPQKKIVLKKSNIYMITCTIMNARTTVYYIF